ncbi:hypothetical protein LCGC14_0535660 [marine sediment metagenome]|uniref:Chromosomal replication initiator DnaA C-terminal domain-containing protein n=1 Tax=marine sediment metagenome TaxID=412755 RepID=A0A0F9SCR7_9ZZZZ
MLMVPPGTGGQMKPDQIITLRDKPCQIELPAADIKAAVADAFSVSVEVLESKGREDYIALARQVAMYLIRQNTSLSLLETGSYLGDRSPATVSFGYQKIANALNDNPCLKGKVDEIKRVLKGVLKQVCGCLPISKLSVPDAEWGERKKPSPQAEGVI